MGISLKQQARRDVKKGIGLSGVFTKLFDLGGRGR